MPIVYKRKGWMIFRAMKSKKLGKVYLVFQGSRLESGHRTLSGAMKRVKRMT